MKQLLRAAICHAPQPETLVTYEDGGLLIEDGRIFACGPYAPNPEAPTRDLRPGLLVPGFIDTHIHYPQIRILGGLGHTLLDWLAQLTLPEEAKLADLSYAQTIAREFVQALAANGTTTALVFGSHFAPATAALFDHALERGLRIYSGLVLSDRLLLPALHQKPEVAYRDSKALLAKYPNYVITPRFALSTTEAMLEVCQTLLREHPGLRVQTHLNENKLETAEVREMFPWAEDYLAVYERYGLINRRSVLAHSVHSTGPELTRLCTHGATVSHCPGSNALLGSGIFPYRRHEEAGVRIALGTDVGAGTGFSLLQQALQAHMFQRVASEPVVLSPRQMLYLATKAGAEALDIADETGDFTPGKSADFVLLSNPNFILASSQDIREVQVAGKVVYSPEERS